MWYRTRVKLNLSTYLSLFRRNNSFYRRLIHSNRKLGGISNRQFFKENFKQVSYRVDWVSDHEIQVVFYFHRLTSVSNTNLPTSLKTRIKSIVFTPIECEVVVNDKILPMTYPQLFSNRTIKTKNRTDDYNRIQN